MAEPDQQQWDLSPNDEWAIRRVLAEHPADDGEPRTAAWLVSLGFVDHLKIDQRRVVGIAHDFSRDDQTTLTYYPDAEGEFGEWEFEDCGSAVRLPPQPTRGHVRRLCAALGVPLTEAAHDT